MRRFISVFLIIILVGSAILTGPAAAQDVTELNVRLYLTSGEVVTGKLINRYPDMIIVMVEDEIQTFDVNEVDKIVTLESLGASARTIKITEFPHLGFLGGTVAFGSVAFLEFNSASEKEKDAKVQREGGLRAQAEKLEDEASTARLIAWGSTAVAVGFLAYGLYPRRIEKRVFPELSLEPGHRSVKLTYVYNF